MKNIINALRGYIEDCAGAESEEAKAIQSEYDALLDVLNLSAYAFNEIPNKRLTDGTYTYDIAVKLGRVLSETHKKAS